MYPLLLVSEQTKQLLHGSRGLMGQQETLLVTVTILLAACTIKGACAQQHTAQHAASGLYAA